MVDTEREMESGGYFYAVLSADAPDGATLRANADLIRARVAAGGEPLKGLEPAMVDAVLLELTETPEPDMKSIMPLANGAFALTVSQLMALSDDAREAYEAIIEGAHVPAIVAVKTSKRTGLVLVAMGPALPDWACELIGKGERV